MLTLLVLLIIQNFTYFFYGKKSIRTEFFNYHKFGINRNGSLGIYTKKTFSKSEKMEIEKILENRYTDIEYTTSNETAMIDFFKNPDKLMMGFDEEFLFPFKVVIHEGNGSIGHGENNKYEFYWFFWKWVLAEKRSTGQS